ncbi:MAG: long-chain fatty acid--CoA ligase [Bacteroidales bacterium]|nr:long-chain fatty acid--CoA ligase [Bacteroidales bacterium]MCF8336933.1 long-chain fatty acid--CoA ligase [Bacteroidales bacterium]
MAIQRLFDLVDFVWENYPQKSDLFAGVENNQWETYSSADYKDAVKHLSNLLMELAVEPGDKIASIANNRPQWNFLDMAVMSVGAVHVPVYPTISESDYKYILNHAEVKYVFVGTPELLRKVERIRPQVPSIEAVYTFPPIEGQTSINELIEKGREYDHQDTIRARKEAIQPDDLATLIYTSGTTGFPKGVMLSHYNILSNVEGVKDIPPIGEGDTALSYLPLCHVYERMLNYFYQYKGLSIYYAENIGTITRDMQYVQPHIMTTVPRLLEKIYDRIVMKGRKMKGIKKQIFFWAIHLGLRFEFGGANGRWYHLQLRLADKLVFKKWREAMGNRMKVLVSGGAALQERLSRSFWAAGIPVLEGYGLTETSPVIAVSHLEESGLRFGTVGPPLQKTQVKIDDDGEILFKGPNVMKGYYKAPELTNEVIDKEGWFHTGDIGHLEPQGQLKITGRKKAIFKTSFGKYISPEHIENKVKESPFIDSVLVVGENQKFAGALIVPDFEHLKNWCRIKGIEYTNNKEMAQKKEIKKRIQQEIDSYNEDLGDTEKIRSFRVIDHEWTVQAGELTPSMKLKREFICNKYRPLIDEIYSNNRK